jgi:hypothetical protein
MFRLNAPSFVIDSASVSVHCDLAFLTVELRTRRERA